MGLISHMAKRLSSKNFAMCGGTAAEPWSHTSGMAKKHTSPRIFLREWRQHRGYNLEKAAGILGMAVSYLSDLEKGNRRWNRDHLETFAMGYGIDWEDLFWNPEVGPPAWRIINNIAPEDRDQAINILKTFVKKTGTEE
jgi:transcriptional regulator with XRE-family HTH domain